MDLDAWHEDLHRRKVDRSGESGASIGAFGFVHPCETNNGTPDGRVVLYGAIRVVQRRDDTGDDENAEHRIEQERAALSWFHVGVGFSGFAKYRRRIS